MRYWPLLLLCTITGCATPEQIAARQAAERQEQEARAQAYMQGLRNQCSALGYQANTDGHRNCMLQLHSQNQQANAAARNAILQQYLQNQSRPTQTNCQRDYFGNVRCQTY